MTLFRTALRNFLAHKGRMALSAVAVLLSVAFVSGTLVFTDTMNTTFDKIFAVTASDVTVSAKGAADGADNPATGKPVSLPAATLAQVGRARGVRSVEGGVSSQSVTLVDARDKNVGATSGAPTIAGNWTSTDTRSMDITSGRRPARAGELMIDADTAKKHHLRLGDTLRAITANGDFAGRVTGIATFRVTNPGASVVYLDTRSAQRELLGATDRFTSINVTAAAGVSDTALKRDVARALDGAGHTAAAYKLQTKKESADANKKDIGSFLDVVKYAMLGFAGIAFLVGIFLIVNTFSMLVAQRTREIGLMRALGSSRRQVNRSVLTEAVLLGVVGSVAGVAAGVGLAVVLMKVMGAAGMDLSTQDLTVTWRTPAVGLLLGIVVTVVAAYVPARRGGKISPMAALRDAGTPADGRAGRVRGTVGTLLTLAGGLALYASTQAARAGEASPLLGLGIVCTLVGFVVVGPLLAGALVRLISAVVLRVFGPVGRLAERNALRNPRRTGATGAALMIGLALVACLSVVGSSMVASATDQLDRSVGADFIVQSGTGQPIVPQAQAAIAGTPGLDHVTRYRDVEAAVTAPDGSVSRHAPLVAADPSYAADLRRDTTQGTLTDAYGTNAMSVGEKYAKAHHVRAGDTLTVAFAGGRTAHLRVAAVTSDEGAIDSGVMYTSTATARRYLPADRLPESLMMFAAARDGQAGQAYTALKKSLEPYPQYTVQDRSDYKQSLKDQIGRLLDLVYGLLALAIVVAVLGVVNTLALSVVERTREIGLMRAIGLSRRQLRRMIRLESVVIALFGALIGLGLGMGWGTAAQKLLALEGLDILSIPWPTIAGVFVASAFVGLLAALFPAFRAGRMNVLEAIATE
ncbi:FtsX-like permease family protein [Streptomyces sp. NPDC047002]|uniref:ABC transporter permease n=1 Tax=Streptomyces sp. NPDC047002 TaxID=3155475 RepID=UPI0034548F83